MGLLRLLNVRLSLAFVGLLAAVLALMAWVRPGRREQVEYGPGPENTALRGWLRDQIDRTSDVVGGLPRDEQYRRAVERLEELRRQLGEPGAE